MLKVKNHLKKVTDRLHFKRRLKERYRIDITNGECVEMIKLIRSGKLKPITKLTTTRSVYKIQIRGKIIKVVYSSSQQSLVTALR